MYDNHSVRIYTRYRLNQQVSVIPCRQVVPEKSYQYILETIVFCVRAYRLGYHLLSNNPPRNHC